MRQQTRTGQEGQLEEVERPGDIEPWTGDVRFPWSLLSGLVVSSCCVVSGCCRIAWH